MINPRLWLEAFLGARGVEKADGRPLYAYRCTLDEFLTLTEIFRRNVPFLDPESGSRTMAQLFCLVASEWWRRNHESGPWKWEGVLECCKLDGRFTLHQLYPFFSRGVGAWGRTLLRDGRGRAFLVTLACEGGLPLKLVQRENTALRRYFRKLLEEHQIFRESGMKTEDLAARIGYLLPPGLQHDVVFQLSGSLIDSIWKLQECVGYSRTSVRDLDERFPGWRSVLPLEIDDEVAQELLRNLVEDAQDVSRRAPARLRVIRTLSRQESAWTLQAELTLPRVLSAEQFSALTGIERAALPSLSRVLVDPGTGTRSFLALITESHSSGQEVFQVESGAVMRNRWWGAAAADAKELYVSFGIQAVGPLSFPGSTALTELPWVFAKSADEQYRLEGTGTVSVGSPECIVAVPPAFKTIPARDAQLAPIGELAGLPGSLFHLRGEAHFVGPDDLRCRVATGQGQVSPEEYRLCGTQVSGIVSHGRTVFKGVPCVKAFSANDATYSRLIPSEELRWRSVDGPPGWRPLDPDCLGSVSVRAMRKGSVLFQARADVLPEGCGLRLRPSDDVNRGRIELEGLLRAEVACHGGPQDLRVDVHRQDGGEGVELRLETRGEPPPTVTVRLLWPGGQSIDLDVPFPSCGARVISARGTTLAVDELVPVERLAGLQALAVSLDEREHFRVEALLCADDVEPTVDASLWAELVPVGLGQHKLDLQALQEPARTLLAETSQLDARVRIRVEAQRASIRPRPFYAQRFDLELRASRPTGQVVLERPHTPFDISPEGLRLEALRLWDPSAEKEILPRVGERCWDFSPASRASGPWLILGWDGGWCRVRPLLWTVRGGSEDHLRELSGLQTAVLIGNEGPRRTAIYAAFDRLVSLPLDEGWAAAFGYLRLLSDIPASVLDVPVVMAHHPEAPVAALLQSRGNDAELVWRLFEELPFCWNLVTLGAWRDAASRYRLAILKELGGLPERISIADAVLDPFLHFASSRRGFLDLVGDWLRVTVLGSPVSKVAISELPAQIPACLGFLENSRQELLRRGDGRHWPIAKDWMTWLLNNQGAIPDELGSEIFGPLDKLPDFKRPVLAVPILAALSTALDVRVSNRRLLFELRQVRAFDPRWFDIGFEFGLRVALGYLIQHHPERFQCRTEAS